MHHERHTLFIWIYHYNLFLIIWLFISSSSLTSPGYGCIISIMLFPHSFPHSLLSTSQILCHREQQGFSWSPELELARNQAIRSVLRGVGPGEPKLDLEVDKATDEFADKMATTSSSNLSMSACHTRLRLWSRPAGSYYAALRWPT